MSSPKNNHTSAVRARRGLLPITAISRVRRREHGSVFPLVAFSLIAVLAFMCFAMDVMRTALTTRKLQFAAQVAALNGYSFASDQTGAYSDSTARQNIRDRVKATASNSWNLAPCGPNGEIVESAVSFSDDDVTILDNPDDPGDLIVQVKARRDGSDALTNFLMPAVFAFGTARPDADKSNPYRVAEIVGQPAARIGAGAPIDADAGTRSAELVGCAALPLAISNSQWASLSDPASAVSTVSVDIVPSTSDDFGDAPAPGHLSGAFINVGATGDSATYYGSGQGELALDELIKLLTYFTPSPGVNWLAPGVVERGSQLSAFDPGDAKFLERKASIVSKLAQLTTGKTYIVPVVKTNPDYAAKSVVVGFARLTLVKAVNTTGDDFDIQFTIAESAPMRNAVSSAGIASVPRGTAAFLPAPVLPFKARAWLPASNGIEPRRRGIVLSPSISPRVISQIN
jgi:hypothetical protein